MTCQTPGHFRVRVALPLWWAFLSRLSCAADDSEAARPTQKDTSDRGPSISILPLTSPSSLMNFLDVCGSVSIYLERFIVVNILSPDHLNVIEGTKDLYIFCTKFFLKLYNFVNNLFGFFSFVY